MSITRTIDGKTVTAEDSERQPCEVWSRVMGYYRPIDNWNIGKQQEHKDRLMFTEDCIGYEDSCETCETAQTAEGH